MSQDLKVCTQLEGLFLQDRPLLDVRAPLEFEQGAFPLSVNHPLLDNAQRHLVGIEYKQQGQAAAIALGEELISGDIKQQRLASWQAFAKANPTGALYCFRGGLRSRITQQWIHAASGIDFPLVEGGYKAMRRYLMDQTTQIMARLRPIVLSGQTGVGKTKLLVQLDNAVDLEGLANHRGSTFGRQIGGQPTQINYENALAIALLKLDARGSDPVIFEDEGPNIGSLHTPQSVFDRTSEAPCVLLEAPLEQRVEITLLEYVVQAAAQFERADSQSGFASYSACLLEALARVQRRLGSQRYNVLRDIMTTALAQQRKGDVSKHRDWIAAMLKDYYDPMYDYQIAKKQGRIIFRGDAKAVQQFLLECR